jgi:hypothetical protein
MNQVENLDFLIGQQFDQINVSVPEENNIFMAALKELTPDMMKKFNIDLVTGTIVRIAIIDNDAMWTKFKSKMIEAVEKLESLVKRIVESQNGILVKIINDSFICFFPDRNKVRSSIFKSIYATCQMRSELEQHPIYLESDKHDGILQIVIFLSYGSTYRRTHYIQRKILYDYYGEIMDNILNQKCTLVNPEHTCFIVNSTKSGESIQHKKLNKLAI